MSKDPQFSPIPIPIDGEITPITQQEIQAVLGDQWSTMTIGDLLDQKTTLQRRYFAMLEQDKPLIADQIDRGIQIINGLIKAKGDNGAQGFLL